MAERPSIRIVAGGPLLVEGVPLYGLERGEDSSRLVERATDEEGYALCRCGASTTKPLCDHEPPYACFDEPAPSGIVPKPFRWDLPDGTRPAIALKPNGPIRVAGGVAVTTTNGEVVDPGARVSLCRCGASGAQPLCDGTHKVIAFREP
jgi:CDGSH-type Zn-finger protein